MTSSALPRMGYCTSREGDLRNNKRIVERTQHQSSWLRSRLPSPILEVSFGHMRKIAVGRLDVETKFVDPTKLKARLKLCSFSLETLWLLQPKLARLCSK